MINKVFLVGNLTQDPELRFTSSQNAVMTIRLATNESWWDKTTQQRKEKVEYHTVVVWGKYAESLNKIISKGTMIAVIGQLNTRSWEDKQGNKRYSTEVKADDVKPLARWGKKEGGDRETDNARQRHDDQKRNGYVEEPEQFDAGDLFNGDDDIPF